MIRPVHHDDGAYHTRLLLALVASIAVVTVVALIPWEIAGPSYSWYQTSGYDPIEVEIVDESKPPEPAEGAPITQFDQPPDEEAEVAEDAGEGEGEEEVPIEEQITPIEVTRLAERDVLEFAEVLPSVDGGLGAFYLNIQYPEAAQQAGIEGRLVLEFVVEPDGRPTDVHVLQSLHALCDSAAVRAVRRTRFIPGRQNGEKVAVRMRLPVRFTLLDDPVEADSSQTDI